jgi:8-oxo-dGTP pyrophosphatase MutT (NUDIX family)
MATTIEQVPDTTRDDQCVAQEAPFGASVVVYRRIGPRYEYLVLHRAHAGPGFEGDWAWTPPSGGRLPGEAAKACARRELLEETGMSLPPIPTAFGTADWEVYLAQAPASWDVRLSDEHDRFAWLPADEAVARCLPELVGHSIRRVADLVESAAA